MSSPTRRSSLSTMTQCDDDGLVSSERASTDEARRGVSSASSERQGRPRHDRVDVEPFRVLIDVLRSQSCGAAKGSQIHWKMKNRGEEPWTDGVRGSFSDYIESAVEARIVETRPGSLGERDYWHSVVTLEPQWQFPRLSPESPDSPIPARFNSLLAAFATAGVTCASTRELERAGPGLRSKFATPRKTVKYLEAACLYGIVKVSTIGLDPVTTVTLLRTWTTPREYSEAYIRH
ncbi:hypothetical protein JCM11491_003790 [Sporobolomyces phaffii]